MPIQLQKWLKKSRRTDLQAVPALEDYSEPVQLNTGAPPFPVPQVVKDAVDQSVADTEHLGYPPNQGAADMRAAVAERLAARGLPLGADDVRITYGALGALNGTLRVIAGAGDEVLIPAPFWFAFPDMISLTGAALQVIQTDPTDNFRLTPERLEQAIAPKSKVLILTNPNNPSGYVYTDDELAGLVGVLERYPYLLVISDEIYDLLVYVEKQPGSIGAFASMRDRVFTISSMSKNYAMSGLRVGWVGASAGLRARFPGFDVQAEASAGVNLWLQAGALAAIEDTDRVVGSIVETLMQRRQEAGALLRRELPELTFHDAQATYYFYVDVQYYIGMEAPPRISGGNATVITDDIELAAYLSEEVNVDVVPGTRCGLPNYFRMTFGVDSAIWAEGISRMKTALSALQTPATAPSPDTRKPLFHREHRISH